MLDDTSAGADGVLLLDSALRCLSADTVFAHIFDIDAQSLADRPLADSALPKPLVAVLSEAADAARAANGVHRAQVSLEHDGVARAFAILALPNRDETVSLLVSPSTSTSGASAPADSDSRTAFLRAQVALFMRDQVLSVVSHDLRGPLNAIHSWGYVLERKIDAADPAAQRALAGIRSGVEQQVKLIETSIDTTRAETRAIALDRAPVALRALTERGAEEARASLATARGVTIEIDSPLAEEQIAADAERLTQALWLMLAFAAEASPSGAAVALTSAIEGQTWKARVAFTASTDALNDTKTPHVLEAFARKQTLHPREAGRISWIFALCKRVAEAHGGTFEQDDIVDATAVRLTLSVPLGGA